MQDRNDLTALSQSMARLDEDAVNGIIDGYITTHADPLKIVDELSQGMEAVGGLYNEGEYALGELVYAGELFKSAMTKIKPYIKATNSIPAGRLIIGTVQGDIHDLGKNIVVMLLECAGFSVIDLGVDVPPEKFVEAVKNSGAVLVGMSLLLTTAIDAMHATIHALSEAGYRERIKIMIGGAPTNERLKNAIGADFYGRDAVEAVAIAKRFFAHQP